MSYQLKEHTKPCTRATVKQTYLTCIDLLVIGSITGFGVGWEGHYCTSMLESFARGMKESAAELSHSNKIFLITGEAMKIMYHGKSQWTIIVLPAN